MPGKKKIRWDEEKIEYMRSLADSNDVEALVDRVNLRFDIETNKTVVRTICKRNGIKIKRKFAIRKPQDIEAVTNLIRRFKLEVGCAYTVIDKKPSCKEPINGEHLKFIYMDDYKLFFRHPLGWMVTYQRHNKLYKVKKEK